MIYDQRFMIAEIAIGQAIHETVRKRVETHRSTWLSNAGTTAAACGRERRHWNTCRCAEGGVGCIDEIHMELEENQAVVTKGQYVVRRACRRRGRSVQVRR